jgi:zinc/manganese transport system ATP-binding protein
MSPVNAAAVLTLQDVGVRRGERWALEGVCGEVRRGAMTAIVGPNGAGKSTLLDTLAGQLAPQHGRIERAPGVTVACLPQTAQIDRSFPIRVGDVVALGAWSRIGLWKALGGGLRREVAEALAAVGLAGCERRAISELSAGQFQRVLFARLMVQNADLILLDEPFNAIDEATTADLLALIHRWHAQGRSIVAVLHDLDQVRTHFDQTVRLSARRAQAWGATHEVLAAGEVAA